MQQKLFRFETKTMDYVSKYQKSGRGSLEKLFDMVEFIFILPTTIVTE